MAAKMLYLRAVYEKTWRFFNPETSPQSKKHIFRSSAAHEILSRAATTFGSPSELEQYECPRGIEYLSPRSAK
jgi:hypothetical protein